MLPRPDFSTKKHPGRRPMLKFYFNGAPNPTKVALFLEEAGLAYEPVNRHPQGRAVHAGISEDQSERQGAGDRR